MENFVATNNTPRPKVLIAGIGGASLGTELLKCLKMADRYEVLGCDISELAFGHFQDGFTRTFVVDRDNYVDSVRDICLREHIDCLIPGAEQPMVLLSQAFDVFSSENVKLVGNSRHIVELFSDKAKTFELLFGHGFNIPLTKVINSADDLDSMVYPCIVKPVMGSGGSDFVYWAADRDEANVYVHHLWKNGRTPIAQEYIPHHEGEFTVGVLSSPEGELISSIALRRVFHNKLSILWKGGNGLISSGYTQGFIEDFPEVRQTAEEIASAVDSRGPINVQGRMKEGVFYPFEINPRFSASTYLRAMAGFNEVDIFLRALFGESYHSASIRPGYYLRSFTEVYVPKDKVMT